MRESEKKTGVSIMARRLENFCGDWSTRKKLSPNSFENSKVLVII